MILNHGGTVTLRNTTFFRPKSKTVRSTKVKKRSLRATLQLEALEAEAFAKINV